MELNIKDIALYEKDGTIIACKADGTKAPRVIQIWFDCNCPFCRRHFLDNLESYLDDIRAGEMTLEMTPVLFLTLYSGEAGALLLTVAAYGPEVYFDVFEAAVFNGLSESVGNDTHIVETKIKGIYESVVTPVIREKAVQIETLPEVIKASYSKLKRNTKIAGERDINSVPYVESRNL